MTRRLLDSELVLVVCAVLATAALSGAAATSPPLALLLVGGAGVAVVSVVLVPLLRVRAPRYVDIAIAAPIGVLPLAPYLASVVPGASALRFAVAGFIVVGLLVGAIPLQQQWARGLGLLILAFAAFQLLPLALVDGTTYAALRLANWLMFVPVAFIAFDRRAVAFATGAAVVTATLMALGVFLQYVGVLPGVWGGLELTSGVAGIRPTYAERYTSFLQNPNDLALFMLMMTVVLYVGFASRQGRPAWRVGAMLLTTLCIVSLLLASSRGALLAIPIIAVVLLAGRQFRSIAGIAVLGMVVIGLLLPLVPSIQASVDAGIDSVADVVAGTDESATGRTQNWTERLATSDGSLALGSGYGGYAAGVTASGRGDERAALLTELTVDNGWLKLLLEEGLVGVIMFSAIVGWTITLAVRRAARSRSVVAAICAALIAAAVFRAFSVDVFDINPWNYAIWLFVGLVRSETGRKQ